MTILEILDKKIERAQKEFEHKEVLWTGTPGGGMIIQEAHGYLNALADLRTELASQGFI